MSDVNHPERNAVSAPSLNGAWFRRERERIAVGLKPLGLRLGIPEHKLVMLELRKQDVPNEWLGVLAELGFRIPQGVAAELPQVSANVKDTSVVESIASVPSVDHSSQTENAVREAVATSSHACMSLADAMRIRAEADAANTKAATLEPAADTTVESTPAVITDSGSPPNTPPRPEFQPADSITTTSTDAQTTETEHQQESQRRMKWTPFYGRWLRERRQQKGIPRADIVKQLGTLPTDVNAIERLNIHLPLAWMPGLLELGALTVAESKAAMQLPLDKFSTKNGMWLRLQRRQCGLTHANVAARLGISRSDVKLVEERRWPLPVEWFPTLENLFSPLPVIRKKHASPKKESATQNDSAPRQSAPQASTSVAKVEAPAPAPKPVPSQTARELTETIMNYRLMLGERGGRADLELLAQIAADLQLALAKDALSYDQLRAVMNLIIGR